MRSMNGRRFTNVPGVGGRESAPGEFMPWRIIVTAIGISQTAWLCPQVSLPGGSRSGPPPLSGRGRRAAELSQLTKRLNEATLRRPPGKARLAPGDVETSSPIACIPAVRYNYRQPALPKYRKGQPRGTRVQNRRSYRPRASGSRVKRPRLSVELFEKAQLQLQRNAKSPAGCISPPPAGTCCGRW